MILNEAELKRLIRDAVREALDTLNDHQSKKSSWMTRKEAANYLGMSAVTFDKYNH